MMKKKHGARTLVGVGVSCLLVAGTQACGAEDGARNERTEQTAAAITPPVGSFQVQLKYDIPAGISGYSGMHPVTFGVPFPQNALLTSHRLRIVDANGVVQQAAFDKKTRWSGESVKWVHVDLMVPVLNGVIPPLYLQYGPTIPVSPAPTNPVVVTAVSGGGFSVNTQASTFRITPMSSSIGAFSLRKWLSGVSTSYGTSSASTQVVHEVGDIDTPAISDPLNQIRATIKVSGNYRSSSGELASEFVTRYRFHSGSRLVRIEHTLTRTLAENDGAKIESLTFAPSLPPGGNVQYGLDGNSLSTSGAFDLRQIDSDRVANSSNVIVGFQLEGWTQQKSASRAQFIGLRWPWQQYPTRIGATVVPLLGVRPVVHLIGPVSPMGLEAEDQVIPPLAHFTEGAWDIDDRKAPLLDAPNGPRIAPIGVAKTYELAYWDVPSGDNAFNLSASVKNTLLQHPIYVTVDPAFAVKAGLPAPSAAKNAAGANATIETALDATFDWVTRERKDEFDYGIWNFGDIQYAWGPAAQDPWGVTSAAYRYWGNNGKGWATIPWMMFLRSGERKYAERAEAHSRHLMDVDTCHVDAFDQFKHKGGTYSYEPLHFGQANDPASISNDSEYLSYAFHVLGSERAKDVILERRHALFTSNGNISSPDVDDHLAFLEAPPGPTVLAPGLRCTREAYNTFGELALIYEEMHEPWMLSKAQRFLNAFVICQAPNGWMPGVKSAEWFTRSFLNAARAFPTMKTQIFNLLKGFEDHIGMLEKPSPTGQVAGPTSLSTLYMLEQLTGAAMYGQALVGYALARAMAVNTDFTNSTVAATRWRGLANEAGNQTASTMREWLVAQARLTTPSPGIPQAIPAGMTYFSGRLPAELPVCGVVGRNVVYVREDQDGAFQVQLDFFGNNQGFGGPLRIRVYPPDATLVSTPIQELNVPFQANVHDNKDFALTDTLLGRSQYDKAKTLSIPADGKTGAYAIEVVAHGTNTALGMAATSSLRKLVHYTPSHSERLGFFQGNTQYCPLAVPLCPPDSDVPSLPQNACSHTLWKMGSSTWNMTSVARAGRAWFQPRPSSTVDFVFADGATEEPGYYVSEYLHAPKLRIFDTTTERCTTKISGTAVGETPVATHCTFTTPAAPGLHNVVLMNDGYYALSTVNGGSWYSSTQSQWFDPTTVQHPPQARFLVPE